MEELVARGDAGVRKQTDRPGTGSSALRYNGLTPKQSLLRQRESLEFGAARGRAGVASEGSGINGKSPTTSSMRVCSGLAPGMAHALDVYVCICVCVCV